MKPRSRQRHKGRRETGNFTLIPHAVQDSANWHMCGGTAIKLLCTLARQYNGRNNGDLCAAMSVLRKQGWCSSDTLTWALRELQHYGLIEQTRQGGLHRASLYALTWQRIDECGGKLDCDPTHRASGDWQQQRKRFRRHLKNATPESGDLVHRNPEQ